MKKKAKKIVKKKVMTKKEEKISSLIEELFIDGANYGHKMALKKITEELKDRIQHTSYHSKSNDLVYAYKAQGEIEGLRSFLVWINKNENK